METRKKKELKAFKLSAKAFDLILDTYSQWVVRTTDFSKYTYGSRCKASLIYDGGKKLMCRQCELDILDGFKASNNWVQCICYRDEKQKVDIRPAISGGVAWKAVKSKICKHYTVREFEETLNKFTAPYDENKNQIHLNYVPGKEDVVYEFNDCIKYDINGAYAKALCDIFPKAKSEILKIYNDRKIKPENKELINYFVGMLCVKDFRATFNWIVQRIRKQMEETINYTGGIVLYANTDGYAVSLPDKKINTSTLLGDFKLEYTGKIQIYAAKNYWILQAGDEITGNALYQVRPLIDLREGKVVEYTRVKDNQVYRPTNIIERRVEIRNG